MEYHAKSEPCQRCARKAHYPHPTLQTEDSEGHEAYQVVVSYHQNAPTDEAKEGPQVL